MDSTRDTPIAEYLLAVFSQEYRDMLDDLDEVQANFRFTDAPSKPIDPRVHYPLDMTQPYVFQGKEAPPLRDGIESALPHFLHAFGNYRLTRTIYTIDRTLFHHLMDSKWPADIPVEAAALPKNGCVLDFPAHEVFGIQNIQGTDRVQVFCTYDMNHQTGGLDLLLTGMCRMRQPDGTVGLASLESLNAWINLSSPNLEDAILDYAIFSHEGTIRERDRLLRWGHSPDEIDQASEEKLFSEYWFRYLKTVLSVLLYINGNDDLLELTPPTKERAMNKAKRRRLAKGQDSLGARRSEVTPRQFQVGKGFASIIQRWEEQERSDAARSGQTVRPHLRAAHAHLYRVGRGRTGQRVRFLPPIPVKGWEAPEQIPASRLVK
jgi:hypothetical protein